MKKGKITISRPTSNITGSCIEIEIRNNKYKYV